MAKRPQDPFKPPDVQNSSLELDTRKVQAKPAAPEPDLKFIAPKKRPAAKYRNPRTSWVMVGVLGLALVGFWTLSGSFWQRIISQNLSVPKLELPTGPPQYKALEKDDAVLIDIDVSPKEARLLLDGAPLPSNPVRLPRDEQTHKISGAADGFEPVQYSFTADKPKTLRLKLNKTKAPPKR